MAGAAVSKSDTYDALLTTTLPHRLKQLWDNLEAATTLLSALEGGYEEQNGGHRIEIPMLYGANDTVGSRGDYDVIPTNKQDGITMGFVPWKDLSGSLVISDKEKAQNSGQEAALRLIDSKMQQLEDSMRTQMETDLFGDGTTANKVYGLAYWITTSTGTLASIDNSVNTWFIANSQTSVGAFTSNGRAKLRQTYNDCCLGQGGDHPSHIITTDTVYEAFESTTEASEVLSLDATAKTVDVGRGGLLYKGAKVLWSTSCTSGYIYILNLSGKKVALVHLPGQKFSLTEEVRPADQRVSSRLISFNGNLVFKILKRQGILTGVT